ncbi:MAG TPA: hypothetical protein DDZ76_13795 [Xanthomonadales bacterium]|nr:hypothetical protein [Xanthomonadales bacterium]
MNTLRQLRMGCGKTRPLLMDLKITQRSMPQQPVPTRARHLVQRMSQPIQGMLNFSDVWVRLLLEPLFQEGSEKARNLWR